MKTLNTFQRMNTAGCDMICIMKHNTYNTLYSQAHMKVSRWLPVVLASYPQPSGQWTGRQLVTGRIVAPERMEVVVVHVEI